VHLDVGAVEVGLLDAGALGGRRPRRSITRQRRRNRRRLARVHPRSARCSSTSTVIGRTRQPLLTPQPDEQNGYVPFGGLLAAID
jgi:hypothetical protein